MPTEPARPIEPPGPIAPEARRFAGRALAFLALTAALFAAADRGADALFDGDLERKYAAVTSGEPLPPIMVLGGSKMLFAVHPRYLEPFGGAYNFAAAGADPAYMLRWWRFYRAHRPAPRVVLLGVEWFFTGDMGMTWHAFEQDSEFWPAADFVGALARGDDPPRALLANRFPLVKERQRLLPALLGRRDAGQPDTRPYDRGWVPCDDRQIDLGRRAWTSILPQAAKLEALRTLVTSIRADGCRLVLVQPPEHRPLSPWHGPENGRLAAIAGAAGAPFLDFNGPLAGPLNDDPTLFQDWGHLREAGSAAFGPRLVQALRATGMLAHRGG